MRPSGAAGLLLLASVSHVLGRVVSSAIQDRGLDTRRLLTARGQGNLQDDTTASQANAQDSIPEQPTHPLPAAETAKQLTATTQYGGLKDGSIEKKLFDIYRKLEPVDWELAVNRVKPTHFLFYSISKDPKDKPTQTAFAIEKFMQEFNEEDKHHQGLHHFEKYKTAIWSDLYKSETMDSWDEQAALSVPRAHLHLLDSILSWMFARRAAEAGGDVIFVQTDDELLPQGRHWSDFEAYELTCAASKVQRLLIWDIRAEGEGRAYKVRWKNGDPPLVPNPPDFSRVPERLKVD